MMGLRRGEVIEMSWDELRRDIKDCNGCMLFHTRMHAVIGRGSSQPVVVFVAEGPGESEDKKGIPFCGKSGIVLDSEIMRIGLSYNSYYIANVVKCRPMTVDFKNRKPTISEIDACYPFLARQLSLLKPKLIVLMGETAKTVESRLKVDLKDINVDFYSMIHPAATLYRRKLYLLFRVCFDNIKEKLSDKYSDNSLDGYGNI